MSHIPGIIPIKKALMKLLHLVSLLHFASLPSDKRNYENMTFDHLWVKRTERKNVICFIWTEWKSTNVFILSRTTVSCFLRHVFKLDLSSFYNMLMPFFMLWMCEHIFVRQFSYHFWSWSFVSTVASCLIMDWTIIYNTHSHKSCFGSYTSLS